MAGREAPLRGDYAWFAATTTRWVDNDVYGHVNNAHHYAFFDSAINRLLIERGGLDVLRDPVVAFVVSSACDYFRPVAWPADLEVGVRTGRVGRSSVDWELGLFTAGDDRAAAAGRMVHVFVDRATGRPTAIPECIRAALGSVQCSSRGMSPA